MLRLMTLGLAMLYVSCHGSSNSQKEKNSDAKLGLQGSCVQKDSTNDSTLCFERSNPSEFDRTMCQASQGSWSAQACDQSQYERICKQETTETIDDGEPKTVLYTYYFKADSNFFCLGDEVTKGAGPESSETGNSAENNGELPKTSATEGQSLYAAKGCVTCHGAISVSTLRGISAEAIVRAFDATQHVNVSWPSVEEALALRDALALTNAEAIAIGKLRYAATCETCHQPLAQSTIIDQTLAGITNSKSLGAHQAVTWPSERDSRAIVAALQEP